jgi:hypothetical protein
MFILIQILFAAYAFISAIEEAAWSWGYRNYLMDSFRKKEQLDIAHKSGAVAVGVIMVTIAIVYTTTITSSLPIKMFVFIISFASTGFWYWLVFDIKYAMQIGQRWDYIGETADTDNWLIKKFGSKAGKVKAAICVSAIVLLNIIFFTLLI